MTIKIHTYDIIQSKRRPPGQLETTPIKPTRIPRCTPADPAHQNVQQAPSSAQGENVSAQKEC